MSLFKRRLIFIFFLCIFLMVAPLLILYASGYRFDVVHRTIYKTGLLILEYAPRDAHVTLDSAPISGRSPHRIGGLAPHSYHLRVTKDGYFPWEKRLWIPEYVTTFIRHILLFRQSTPEERVVTATVTAAHPSSPLVAVGVRGDNGITVTLVTHDTMEPIAPLPTFTALRRLAWSAHGKYLLVVGDLSGRTVASVVTVQQIPTVVGLNSITTTPLTALTWDSENDDVLLGYGRENGASWLFAMNVKSRHIDRSLVAAGTSGLPFVSLGNRIVLLTQEQSTETNTPSTTMIFRPLVLKTNAIEQRVTIPTMNRALLMSNDQPNLMTVFDRDAHTAYLVEQEPRSPQPIVETFSNVYGSAWSANGHRFVYWNDHELFLWDLEQNTKERVFRSDENIARVFWHPGNEYLFIQTKKAITILEVDGRDQRNSSVLSMHGDIRNAGIDTEGAWLWVWSGKDKEERIGWYPLK